MAIDPAAARLAKRMEAIPKAVREAVKPAIAKGAEEMVAGMKNLVPVETGRLRDSIGWTFGPPPEDARFKAGAPEGEAPADLSASVYAGGNGAYWARWVEFGTRAGLKGSRVPDGRKKGKTRESYRTHPGTAKQPFFFPVVRAQRKRVMNRIKRAVAKAAKEAWKG